jgi:hypothetical protein
MLAPPDHVTLTATPTLQAVYADPDGNAGGIDFRLFDAVGRDVTGSPTGYAWSGDGPSGRTVYYSPPDLPDGRYTWPTRAWDGRAHSSPQWAYTGTFTIDRTAPAGDLGVGERRFYTLDEQALTDRSRLGVNVANGNLVVSDTDVRVAGTGQDLVVTRTYNSQSVQTSELGPGWVHALGDGVRLQPRWDGARIFEDPSGARMVFTPNGRGGWRPRGSTPPSRAARRRVHVDLSPRWADLDVHRRRLEHRPGGPKRQPPRAPGPLRALRHGRRHPAAGHELPPLRRAARAGH